MVVIVATVVILLVGNYGAHFKQELVRILEVLIPSMRTTPLMSSAINFHVADVASFLAFYVQTISVDEAR